MEYQRTHSSPERIFRAAILNGSPVPEHIRTMLEGQGIDTWEREARIRQQLLNGETL